MNYENIIYSYLIGTKKILYIASFMMKINKKNPYIIMISYTCNNIRIPFFIFLYVDGFREVDRI